MLPELCTCPLCGHPIDALPGAPRGVDARRYHLCGMCYLIFVDQADHPGVDEERARYLLHRNSLDDSGYVDFLRRILDPALPLLPRGARILDYGCGPADAGTPVLARLLERAGHVAELHDPFFFPRAPHGVYDAVFATEVIEHFRRPGEEIARLVDLVAPGGYLAIMTERWTTLEAFRRWPYTSDPTHLAFYHERTLTWIAERYHLHEAYKDPARVWIARTAVPVN